MSETPPPRRPLATFLRATPAAPALIPTPAVPPTEPLEQAPPAPMAELPPAPAQEPIPAPLAPLAPAPGTDIPDTTHDDGTQGAPVAGVAAGPVAAQQAMANPRRTTTPPATQAPPVAPAIKASTPAPTADPSVATVSPLASASSPASPSASAASLTSASPAVSAQPPASAEDASTADLHAPAATPATGRAAAAADADAVWEPDAAAIHAGTQAPSATPLLPLPTPNAPAFARRGLSRPRLRASGRQWALLVGLVGVLALQIVIADRAHLAGDARWRPVVSAACAVLRCSLPAWREPAALTLLNREVRPMPGMPGVLQIQASFRNDARWAQAWPWLQLSLSDADGRVIGTRVLGPQEYLGQAPAEQDTLAPGQAVQVAFRVREPAASTAAFSFDFR